MFSLASLPIAARYPQLQQTTRLQQSLLLALLLHVWLVLMIGNTPGGSAWPGEGVWGRLNVTLDLGSPGGDEADAAGPPVPAVPNQGAVGRAPRERFGGAVRSEAEAAEAPAQPGAAKLGVWNEQAAELARGHTAPEPRLPAARLDELAPVSTEAPTPAPVLKTTAVAPPPLNRQRPASGDASPALRPSRVPEALPRFEAPALPAPPAPVIKNTAETGPALARPAPAPAAAAPAVRQEVEAALPRFEAPALPEPPQPVTKTTADVPPPLARPTPSRPEFKPSGPSPAPEALPRFEAPKLAEPQRVTKTTSEGMPALQRPARRAAETLPATQLQRPEASQSLPKFEAPPAPVPAQAQAPTPTAVSGVDPSMPAATSGSADAAKDASPLARPAVGSPDAGSRLGQDVATAPSTPPSAPKLDLEWKRPRGGEISRQGSRGVLDLLAHPPERKSKLSEDLQNATKKDCREAYSGAGLLAAVPLLLDAARDKGCRW